MHPDWRSLVDHGKALQLGAQLLASVPSEKRPNWIGAILEAVLALTQRDILGFGEKMVTICGNRSAWASAERLFHELRQYRLDSGTESSQINVALADLLEIAAKVVFNASGSQPGFDAHAGARILPIVGRIMTIAEQEPGHDDAVVRVENALWRLADGNG